MMVTRQHALQNKVEAYALCKVRVLARIAKVVASVRRINVRGTDLDGPLALFLLSAAVGLWIAYDRSAAWPRFFTLLGGVALCATCARMPENVHLRPCHTFSPLHLTFRVLPTLLAGYSLLTSDWLQWTQKLSWLNPLRYWFASWQPNLAWQGLNPNVVGGIIAAYLPLQIAALGRGSPKQRRFWGGVGLLSLSVLGLLMSASRGAWLALTLVSGMHGLWRLGRQASARRETGRKTLLRAVIGFVIIGFCTMLLVLTLRLWNAPLDALRTDRPTIWRNSLDLVSDYPFTGVGLGNFPMAYSTYVLLVHVAHTSHAHNLFLDLWLEQGILGLIAFLWLLGVAARPHSSASLWRSAALASLGVVVLHGLVDDVFYGYGGRIVWLLFIPPAMLVRRTETTRGTPPTHLAETGSTTRWRVVIGNVVVVLVLSAMFQPAMRAMFYANLGALAQTQAELSVYRWPEWPLQDMVRRRLRSATLTSAIVHYQTALALDPVNATVHRRLGQIELSLGRYDAARRHLEAAYAAAPGQRATRQLLGEAYAIAGKVTSAVALWQTTDVTLEQLRLRHWWYTQLGEEEHATWLMQAAWVLFRNSKPGTRI